MHKEILTPAQIDLLPFIAEFRKNFGLVGGTAIALHIGHRESIDFDMFSPVEFSNAKVRNVFARVGKKFDRVFRDEKGQFTFVVGGVQMTFFHYPFPVEYSENFEKVARMPTLLTLAAMKAFALGRRAKWKDYVDLYFIMRDFHPLSDIVEKTEYIFGTEFNAKLLREQLSYFDDIDYSDAVAFKPGFEVPDNEIKKSLTEWSLA
ncbi:MAG: nucleotidyl transferase AbiEii/AbiGii toxin family protein [Patescibacteria group bacterium]